MSKQFENNIFINCPFDDKYKSLFRPLLFTCLYCGLEPRVANTQDAAASRLEQIIGLITDSKYSIHDISRMELSGKPNLPRFNMPFELGIEFGIRYGGDAALRTKLALVIDQDPYRYRSAISDLAGFDIMSYGNDEDNQAEKIVRVLRDWFTRILHPLQSPWRNIWYDFNEFTSDLATIINSSYPDTNIELDELTETEFIYYAKAWIESREK